jgi:hypothetical protein
MLRSKTKFEPEFVLSGHDFSHAENATKINPALAAEACRPSNAQKDLLKSVSVRKHLAPVFSTSYKILK